jgi:predicted short-subunit dehydrogenase-like oxidoreductase (DUF2520 family)
MNRSPDLFRVGLPLTEMIRRSDHPISPEVEAEGSPDHPIPLTITLIGAGNLASTLGPALRAAGYRIDAVGFRDTAESRRRARALARKVGAKAVPLDDADTGAEIAPQSDVVWLCHTDDALSETARRLARKPEWSWKGKIVLHSSGALTSDVLRPLKTAGARVGSLHPMMTFVPGTTPRLRDVPFAVEGDRAAVAVARRIVRDLHAEMFAIRKEAKVLYHALGSFSSPLVVATLATAERVGRAAGLTAAQTSKMMGPILEQTLRNYLERGPAAAFSGPIKRGDLETVRRHLRELGRVPEAREVYRALVRSALRDLPSASRKEMRRLVR